MKLANEEKPVVVSMGDVAASGGIILLVLQIKFTHHLIPLLAL